MGGERCSGYYMIYRLPTARHSFQRSVEAAAGRVAPSGGFLTESAAHQPNHELLAFSSFYLPRFTQVLGQIVEHCHRDD